MLRICLSLDLSSILAEEVAEAPSLFRDLIEDLPTYLV